jgi:hypothetical protein
MLTTDPSTDSTTTPTTDSPDEDDAQSPTEPSTRDEDDRDEAGTVPPMVIEAGPDASVARPIEASMPLPTETTPSCAPGFTECDAGCVSGSSCTPPPSCEDTCHHDNAQTECIDDDCVLVACEDGWVDCDGQLENGCEVEFGNTTPQDPVVLTELNASEDDDWAGLPVYPIEQPCSGCGQDFSGEPAQPAVFKDVAPAPRGDLRAGASFAWNTGGIAIRVVVFDDELVGGNDDARFNDNLHLVFDGDRYGNSSDAEDHHLYFGLDGVAWDQRIPEADRLRDLVALDVTELGSCRLLHAQVSREYLSGGEPFTLADGETYGFALSINDFDDSDDMPPEPERQHQEFLLSPGENYVYGPRMLPRFELQTDLLDADAGAP